MEPVKTRCCVYAIQYHIVWWVKYRRKVLNTTTEARLIGILKEYAEDNGFSIVEANSDRDHIHLLVQAPPTIYISDIVKGMKGRSARRLPQEFPEIKRKLWGGHIWNPSYKT